MVPIEPVFDAIKEYWRSHYGVTCIPEIPDGNWISDIDSSLNPLQDTQESSLQNAEKDEARDLTASTPSVNLNSDTVAKREIHIPDGKARAEPSSRDHSPISSER